MPFISRWANNYTTTTTAAIDTVATTLTVAATGGLPSLTVPAGAVPAVTAILVDSELMYVTAVVSGTSLTVQRGQEGTTAAAHSSGATVRQVVTRDTLYNNSAPGAISSTVGATYTPDLSYKYHILTTGASNVTINAPTSSLIALQAGDELRLVIKQGATGRTITFNAVYNNTVSGAVAPSATANAVSSLSYVYDGRGPAVAGAWIRQL